jgi:purine-nucleoside/S-methyl-5'-thioadenosine phosphorylase / adenosine deaminase
MSFVRPEWPAPANVRALVTTRALGDMARGSAARLKLRAELPGDPVWLHQVHGIAVFDVDAEPESGVEPVADAAITRERRNVCAVTVADCMPVFLTNAAGTAVGVAHAGWRGLCAGVLEATAAALGGTDLIAWLGPAIGPQSYEVGPEVREAFMSRDPSAVTAFMPGARAGHWLLDLYSVARARLRQCGIGRIYGGGFCTYTDSRRFFSYRRDGTRARMAAAIWVA